MRNNETGHNNIIWTIREEITDRNSSKNALGKARNDIYRILNGLGYPETVIKHPDIDRHRAGTLRKLVSHYTEAKKWKEKTALFRKGNVVLIQYPPVNHTMLFSGIVRRWKRKGVISVAFIHDLELIRHAAYKGFRMRKRIRIWLEETSVIRQFDYVIVHNEQMKKYLCERHRIAPEKVLCLGIFDYLTNDDMLPEQPERNEAEVVIAGNLEPEKAGYVYKLPDKPSFRLYGANYEEYHQDNVTYEGAYEADELIRSLKGQYGLIWDGDSPDTCGGTYGSYLRYNNPHKTSLYLAAGIPVIIWEEAAMAQFIREHGCGITVRSLADIASAADRVSDDQYRIMKANAVEIGKKLRVGYYTKEALYKISVIADSKDTGI